ncbi:MAG: chlorite dismutase family protein [Ilumatobacter sp.]
MLMQEGLSVVHLFAKPTPGTDRVAVYAAVEQAESDGCQVVTVAMLGHKADLCVMALSNDWNTLRSLQTALQRAGLDIVDSYVSITEISEYAKGLPENMLKDRLYPNLPPDGLRAFSFYPMSKKREGHANWFATPFDDRRDMMMEHGKSGRQFAGQLVQLISASSGLDDFEWGVTLFAKSPEVVKNVVYTMRYDEGSAVYGEFGAFYVGYVDAIDSIL